MQGLTPGQLGDRRAQFGAGCGKEPMIPPKSRNRIGG